MMLFNRDLSWLGFNYRVLLEAKDESVPLYDRLKFLSIFSSNLDEFFRVRYPAIVAFSRLGKKTIRKEALLSEKDVAEKVHETINAQLTEFGHILVDVLIPAFKRENIYLYYNEPLLPVHTSEAREIFLSKVLSFIQPIFLDTDTSGNFLPENNQSYLVVTLKNNVESRISHVILNIPAKKLRRFYVLSAQDSMRYVIFIDDILRENLNAVFPGQDILEVYNIKFNRDAELKLADEYNENLLEKLEKSLSKRETGAASRFLYEKGMPANLRLFLSSLFDIELSDMFEGGRYHNLTDMFHFPTFDQSLQYPPMHPVLYPPIGGTGDIFKMMPLGDILLHLPYHSYTPVLSFFNQAAVDPEVTEIYITLYRVAAESHIVNALISAAKNGKRVLAFIELKARFDEANNIKWSRVMKKAGVKLIYSDPGVKVHSKIALVKKKSQKQEVSYAILSTGNFNENTASFYTDHVLMTMDVGVTSEIARLFEFLQIRKPGIEKANLKFNRLLVSRFNLLDEFERLIDVEIKNAAQNLPARIRIKVNNLEEQYFISLLYKAGKAGVKVDLLVRSICCLIPGKGGLSENITVRRIVDRYLEHSRIFIFGSGEKAVVVIGSSDLMTRNLRRRIEVCVRVADINCSQQLIKYFDFQWQDNVKATVILPDGTQQKNENGDKPFHASEELYSYISQLHEAG